MPRRVTLPGADELFRTTGGTALTPTPRAASDAASAPATEAGPGAEHAAAPAEQPTVPAGRRPLADGGAAPQPGVAGPAGATTAASAVNGTQGVPGGHRVRG
ncbi:hypothetical protein ACFP3V_09220, partial [Streptacidiphilus monticola]